MFNWKLYLLRFHFFARLFFLKYSFVRKKITQNTIVFLDKAERIKKVSQSTVQDDRWEVVYELATRGSFRWD